MSLHTSTKLPGRIVLNITLAGLAWATGVSLNAAEPLAVFECQERLKRDWPQTLVTYRHEFPPGMARVGDLRLVDPTGAPRCY